MSPPSASIRRPRSSGLLTLLVFFCLSVSPHRHLVARRLHDVSARCEAHLRPHPRQLVVCPHFGLESPRYQSDGTRAPQPPLLGPLYQPIRVNFRLNVSFELYCRAKSSVESLTSILSLCSSDSFTEPKGSGASIFPAPGASLERTTVSRHSSLSSPATSSSGSLAQASTSRLREGTCGEEDSSATPASEAGGSRQIQSRRRHHRVRRPSLSREIRVHRALVLRASERKGE